MVNTWLEEAAGRSYSSESCARDIVSRCYYYYMHKTDLGNTI